MLPRQGNHEPDCTRGKPLSAVLGTNSISNVASIKPQMIGIAYPELNLAGA